MFDAAGPARDHDMQRCAGGWADAEAMHERMVGAVRAALGMGTADQLLGGGK